MSVRSDVLLWANRVTQRAADCPPNTLLEIKADATIEDAQEAFHKIARTGHPDLHRASLTPEELELVTSAYARVAGAYQEFRSKRMQTTRMRALRDELPARKTPSEPNLPLAKPGLPGVDSSTPPGGTPSMNSKALIYYRKVEMALRRGDVRGAALQMKMAIAADPGSSFLRSALAEIQAEIAKAGS